MKSELDVCFLMGTWSNVIQFPCFRGIFIWLFLNRNFNFVTAFYVMMTSKNNFIEEAIPLLFPVYACSIFQEKCWHKSCCFCSWGRFSWSVVQGSKSSVSTCKVTHPAVISQIPLWWKVQPCTWGGLRLRSSSNLVWLHQCGHLGTENCALLCLLHSYHSQPWTPAESLPPPSSRSLQTKRFNINVSLCSTNYSFKDFASRKKKA